MENQKAFLFSSLSNTFLEKTTECKILQFSVKQSRNKIDALGNVPDRSER